jgi:hypothetical protein
MKDQTKLTPDTHAHSFEDDIESKKGHEQVKKKTSFIKGEAVHYQNVHQEHDHEYFD